MAKKIVDTNVIIRFLTNDSPQLARQAEKIFSQAKKRELVIPDFVLTEIVWALLSFYQLKKEALIEKLEAILAFDRFELNRTVLAKAIAFYRENNISFVDAYLLALSETKKQDLITFDQRLKKLIP